MNNNRPPTDPNNQNQQTQNFAQEPQAKNSNDQIINIPQLPMNQPLFINSQLPQTFPPMPNIQPFNNLPFQPLQQTQQINPQPYLLNHNQQIPPNLMNFNQMTQQSFPPFNSPNFVPQNNGFQNFQLQNNPQLEQLKNTNKQLKEDKNQLEEKIKELESQLQRYQKSVNQIDEKDQIIKLKDLEIDKLEKDLKAKQQEKNELSREITSITQKLELQKFLNEEEKNGFDIQIKQLTQELEFYKKQNEQLRNPNTQFPQPIKYKLNFTNKQNEVQGSNLNESEELKFLKQSNESFKKENEEKINQIKDLKQKLTMKDQSIQGLTLQLKEKNETIKVMEKKLIDSDQFKKIQEEQINKLNQTLQSIIKQEGKLQDAQAQYFDQIMKEANNQKQQLQKQYLKDEEFKRNEFQLKQQQLQDQSEMKQIELEKKRNQARLLRQKMQESHGKMDVCFLVDVTQSMEKLKQQTVDCINESIQEIKKLTNRDVQWGSLCYKDRLESRDNKAYQNFNFSLDSDVLKLWLQDVQCQGGGDQAEDIRGGIKDMCKYLNWTNKFKIAILITDAPCHGSEYHQPTLTDNHRREDLSDALDLLIQNEIIFIGINFNKYTTQMFEKIQQYYNHLKKENYFMFFDMQYEQMDQVAKKMVTRLGEAAQQATQTNRRETRVKESNDDTRLNSDGAIEALCKLKNFMTFDTQKGIKLVNSNFNVYKIELKEESFQQNIKTIEIIQVPNDFSIQLEGQWQCLRTQAPFAFGQMKAVFLMKKKDSKLNEIYVVKTPKEGLPYSSMNEAIKECKSHLICQRLMNNFFQDLSKAKSKKSLEKFFQKVVYSDILIVEENDQFWIAERFFNGQFVKYNNNYGFINEEETDLNRIAQAFSYYTFFISDFNYMINDIQGVNIYFTDPAINTKAGNFDETDMGEDGISMFMANFNGKKKKLAEEILELMDLIEENKVQPNELPLHQQPPLWVQKR